MFPSLRVGFFLAVSYIRRSSFWTTGLVIFVMMLTFLNLVFVTGILVGLIEGAVLSFKGQYAGDILISNLPEKAYIERSQYVNAVINSIPEVEGMTSRYISHGELEANYLRSINTPNLLPDVVGTEIAGIDPVVENKITSIGTLMIEGDFLEPGDDEFIVLGAYLIERHIPGAVGLQTLSGVYIGDKVRLKIGTVIKEYTVKGILQSKADQVDIRAYLIDRELRKLIGRTSYNVNEIAIVVKEGSNVEAVKNAILRRGVGTYALVRLPEEALGTFLDDIKKTFALLGDVIGSISLVVASITIFIVIFITAITRRKYIGILKGIGISSLAVEMSYIMLSILYAVVGVALGLIVLYGFLVPYFLRNPIDFPFSEGILSVTTLGTAVRAALLIVTTIIAGYIPAKLIVRKNTLDAILGR